MTDWNGKRVAILGVSVEGKDSASYFLRHGATVVCCDRRPREDLGALADDLEKRGVTFQTGDAYLAGLAGFDAVVRTPGMSLRFPELQPVIAQGKLTSQTKLILHACPAPVIGITGTKGKGTTSTLIFEMLKAAGRTCYLGGNVGIPLLSTIDSVKPSDWVVLELSSFQLEDVDVSPHIAVVLRITQEHLANQDKFATNFHQTREDYVHAKEPIVSFQKPSDIAVVNAADPTSSGFATLTPAAVRTFSRYGEADCHVADHTVWLTENGVKERICSSGEIILRGDHNLENIAAAVLAARAADVPLDVIRAVVRTFKGLEHRLEECGTVDGVTYYDDSFSTVPETTEAAVEAFDKPMTLIVGGSDKGSQYGGMAATIARSPHVETVIYIGLMGPKIRDELVHAGYTGLCIDGGATMADILAAARQHTRTGGVVVMSPACASFDMFKNYKERGNQFKHGVATLSSGRS